VHLGLNTSWHMTFSWFYFLLAIWKWAVIQHDDAISEFTTTLLSSFRYAAFKALKHNSL
jgi:hypothetical protein